MTKILFATGNQHKAEELQALFAKENLAVEVLTNRDFPEAPKVIENGTTFTRNAQLKAHQMAQYSGLITLADDSGLMVDKLNGAPGIYSARYAGIEHDDRHNNAKLLAELGGVETKQRTATFHTTIVVSSPADFTQDLIVEGECHGYITTMPIGEQTFGYDPLFYVPEKGKTFAQMTTEEKNQLSHRGLALKKLITVLPAWLKQVSPA